MSQNLPEGVAESQFFIAGGETDGNLFITSNLLHQAFDCDVWLTGEIDGEKSVIKSDVCAGQDRVNHLAEGVAHVGGCDNGSDCGAPAAVSGSRTDRNKNLLRDAKPRSGNHSNFKCDQIEKYENLRLELVHEGDKVRVCVRGELGREALPPHYVSLVGLSGHLSQARLEQRVASVGRLRLSDSSDVFMASLRIETGLNVFFCPVVECAEAYFRLANARLHSLVHLRHKPYKCRFPNCVWEFYTSFKLKRHEETHAKKKDFVCPYPDCLRKFTTIYNLNGHKRRHEKSADLPCPVKSCDKLFQNSKARQLHLKCHRPDEAPYKCTMRPCKKAYFFESALQAHSRSHSHKESELNCQWPNCGRTFEHPYKLKEHLRSHTGQRPYRCLYEGCKWSFTTASKLRRHEITHTNERKFHCTIGTCNKSFLRSEHLKDHTLTHIGQQRLFHCQDCTESFASKPSLYLHAKKEHPEKSEACARTLPYSQSPEKLSPDILLEQAVQSLGVPSDIILGTGLIPDTQLELLEENENFSTVNLRDLE